MRLPSLSPRAVRWLAVSYALKSVLFVLLWVVAPEWTARPLAWAREAVARLSLPSPEGSFLDH
jgi:hypothetical protein